MNNTATYLNPEMEIKKAIIPFGSVKIKTWIKYDSRDVEEKAIILFLNGKKRDTICNSLDIAPSYLAKLVFKYYEKSYRKEVQRLSIKANMPNNYSSWNDKILNSHLRKIRKRL